MLCIESEYNQWKGLEKLIKKHMHVSNITIAGISLQISSTLKFLKNAKSAFLRNFRAPYLQRHTSNVNNIYIFGPILYRLSDGGIRFFNSRYFLFQHFFFLGQTFRTKK